MKIAMFLTLILGLNTVVFAKDIKCEFTDVTYVNQFALEINNIEIAAGAVEGVDFDFTLRAAGRDPKIERFTVSRDGAMQVFAAGSFYKHETARLFSVVKGAELEYINILIDVPPLHTSQIRFLDGKTYFGSCKSL